MRFCRSAAFFVLVISCSFVRDPDRYSSGSEALDGGSGGTGGSAGASCKAGGESCQLSSDCCTGSCFQNLCACNVEGGSCQGPAECCSGNCDNGKCGSCDPRGATCDPLNERCCPELACKPGGSEHSCMAHQACVGQPVPPDPQSLLQACDAQCELATQDPARTQCYVACVKNATSLTENCASCYPLLWLCFTDLNAAQPSLCPDACCKPCMDAFAQCADVSAACPF